MIYRLKRTGSVSRQICGVLALLCLSAPALARQQTLGWLEWAWLQPGHVRLKTKLDTGARTSSIDATDISLLERDNKPWVRFRIPLKNRPEDTDRKEDLVFERPLVGEVAVKDHARDSQRRYVVELELCLAGETFRTPVTLADRSGFNYPLLLGRLALQGRAVIDPAAIFIHKRRCKKSRSKRAPS